MDISWRNCDPGAACERLWPVGYTPMGAGARCEEGYFIPQVFLRTGSERAARWWMSGSQPRSTHHTVIGFQFPSTSLWLFSSSLTSTCQVRKVGLLNSCGFWALLFIVSLLITADCVEGELHQVTWPWPRSCAAPTFLPSSYPLLAITCPSEVHWTRQFVDLSTAVKDKRFLFGSFSSWSYETTFWDKMLQSKTVVCSEAMFYSSFFHSKTVISISNWRYTQFRNWESTRFVGLKRDINLGANEWERELILMCLSGNYMAV